MMHYYRDTETGDILSHRDLEIEYRQGHKSFAPWEIEGYVRNCLDCTLEDVTSLYEWLSEKYLWSEEEEKKPIDIETAIEWLEYWKEDYSEFFSTFDPYKVTEAQIMDVWNHIVKEEV